jgi:hypothetical protein
VKCSKAVIKISGQEFEFIDGTVTYIHGRDQHVEVELLRAQEYFELPYTMSLQGEIDEGACRELRRLFHEAVHGPGRADIGFVAPAYQEPEGWEETLVCDSKNKQGDIQ